MQTVSWQVSNLREQPQWLPQIALWHHNEWLKTRDGSAGRYRSAEAMGQRLEERRQALARHLEAGSLPVTFVAHCGTTPLGTVSLVYYQFSQQQASSEWLTNLFVLPAYRRQGIASGLLEHAIAYARVLRLPRLLLYTANQTEFYRKRRWRCVNRGRVQGEAVEIMDLELSASPAAVW